VAKKTKSTRKSKRSSKRSSSEAKAPATFGDPAPKGGAGFATSGFATDDLPVAVPHISLKNRGEAVIRFLEFPGPDGSGTFTARIQAHRLRVSGRWRWFTVPEEGDPLSQLLESRPSWQWVSMVLVRKSEDQYHQRMISKPAVAYFGKRAVEQMNEIVLPKLKQRRISLGAVDLLWKRIGEGTDSQHFFELLRPRPLTPAEKQGIKETPIDVLSVIKPLSLERLTSLGRRLADAGGGRDVPQGLGEAEEAVGEAATDGEQQPWFD